MRNGFRKKIFAASLGLLMMMPAYAFGLAENYFVVSKARAGREFGFPILNRRGARLSTERINYLLQLSELRGLVRGPKVFDMAMIDDGTIYGGKKSMSFRVHQNNPRIFSVEFSNSSCGATCRYWVSYYNFNSQNGDRMTLSDLFTKDGYRQFIRIVTKTRIEKYRKEVSRKVPLEEQEGYLSTIGSIESDEFDDFALEAKSILIDGENLLNKGMKFNGIVMQARFDFPVFKNLLNEYGKTVFGIRKGNVAAYRSEGLPQLFAGNVGGTAAFVAVIGRPVKWVSSFDGSAEIEGVHAYSRFGKGIYLTGKMTDDRIELTEHVLKPIIPNNLTNTTHKWEDGGTISGIFTEKNLSGFWSDKAKARSLPITADRY